MYLLAPFILQNLKEILRADPELTGCATFRTKMAHLSWTIFFGRNHHYYFHLPICPFHYAKFEKILTADPRVTRMCHFGPKMVHLPQKKFFFWKIINTILIYLLDPFIVQNFKKVLPVDPGLRGCAIFGPKMAHFPNENFFSKNLLMSLVFFVHAYLHTINQSQILIYWWNIDN